MQALFRTCLGCNGLSNSLAPEYSGLHQPAESVQSQTSKGLDRWSIIGVITADTSGLD